MSKYCKINEVCNYRGERSICSFESHCGKQIVITNAMKIRSMSDDELAEFIQDVWCDNHGSFVNNLLSKSANPSCILEMLQSEVIE